MINILSVSFQNGLFCHGSIKWCFVLGIM